MENTIILAVLLVVVVAGLLPGRWLLRQRKQHHPGKKRADTAQNRGKNPEDPGDAL